MQSDMMATVQLLHNSKYQTINTYNNLYFYNILNKVESLILTNYVSI